MAEPEPESDDTEDVVRMCRDCGHAFRLPPGELQFYAEQNLLLPKRCKPCRVGRRRVRAAAKLAGD